jgi:hypothetical protein
MHIRFWGPNDGFLKQHLLTLSETHYLVKDSQDVHVFKFQNALDKIMMFK